MNRIDESKPLELIDAFCTPRWKQKLLKHAITLEYSKGEHIVKQGDLMEYLDVVIHGKVKVWFTLGDQSRIVRLASDGQVLGHRGFGGEFHYSISGTALEDCIVTRLPLKDVVAALQNNAMFSYYMMKFYAEELKRSEKHFKSISTQEVKFRVAHVIYSCYQTFGLQDENGLLAFTLKRRDMADMAATTYESVIRSLAALNQEGVIALEKKQVRIKDMDQLKTLATV